MDVNDIFASVKDSLSKETTASALYKEKIKFEQGKDYLLRLVPYTKEGRDGLHKSIYHYIQYSWVDDNGSWHNVLSPRTYDERCPIADWSAKINKHGTTAEKEDKDKRLFYKSGYYVNVYVIDDPTTPENNGKVKILNMGKALYNKMKDALDGALDESWTSQYNNAVDEDKQVDKIEVGKKVFDLSRNGVNLLVRVRKNQYGLNDYSQSEFVLKEAKLYKKGEDGKKVLLTDDEREEIKNGAFDLTKVERVMSSEDISKLFKTTFLGIDDTTEEKPAKQTVVKSDPVEPEDDEPNVSIDDDVPSFDDNSSTAEDDIDEFLNEFNK